MFTSLGQVPRREENPIITGFTDRAFSSNMTTPRTMQITSIRSGVICVMIGEKTFLGATIKNPMDPHAQSPCYLREVPSCAEASEVYPPKLKSILGFMIPKTEALRAEGHFSCDALRVCSLSHCWRLANDFMVEEPSIVLTAMS